MKFRTLTLLPLFLLAVVSCTFRRSNPQLTEIERRLDSFPEEMWERLGEPELQQSLGRTHALRPAPRRGDEQDDAEYGFAAV